MQCYCHHCIQNAINEMPLNIGFCQWLESSFLFQSFEVTNFQGISCKSEKNVKELTPFPQFMSLFFWTHLGK